MMTTETQVSENHKWLLLFEAEATSKLFILISFWECIILRFYEEERERVSWCERVYEVHCFLSIQRLICLSSEMPLIHVDTFFTFISPAFPVVSPIDCWTSYVSETITRDYRVTLPDDFFHFHLDSSSSTVFFSQLIHYKYCALA